MSYELDPDNHAVMTRVWGVMSDADALGHERRLIDDSSVPTNPRQIIDLREVAGFDVTQDGMLRMVELDNAHAARLGEGMVAIVAPEDLMFGISRMFQIVTDSSPWQVSVFRTTHEARRWLDLSPETAAPE